MDRQTARGRVAFWVASAVAAAYWLLLSWRIEQALWNLVAWLALESSSVGGLVSAMDTALTYGFIAITYALPPLLLAVCLWSLRVETDRRTWAIPLTGFLLLLAFLVSESMLLGGGALDLLRISMFADASWLGFAAALCGLCVGSAGAWALLGPFKRGAFVGSSKGMERTVSSLG